MTTMAEGGARTDPKVQVSRPGLVGAGSIGAGVAYAVIRSGG